mgnify:CR=1 FL=1
MNLDDLKKQLENTELEFEQAKAHVHRCDGAVQILRHFIKELEAESTHDHSQDPSDDSEG